MIKKRGLLYILIILISISSVSAYIKQGNLEFYDYYDTQSTNSDAITWVGTEMFVRYLGTPAGTMAMCWDWNGDNVYTACWAISSWAREECKKYFSEFANVCNTAGCGIANPWEWHYMDVEEKDVGSGDGNPMKVKTFIDCDLPIRDYGIPTNNGKWYYILSERQYDCSSVGGTYKDEGYYGEGWVNIVNSISCSSGYGCDESKDDSNADFGNEGTSIPSSPCSKLPTQTCTSDSDCTPNYCNFNTNQCTTQHCGNGNCGPGGEDKWNCPEDCGQPCSSTQCKAISGVHICYNSGSVMDSSAYYCYLGSPLFCSSSHPCRQGGSSNYYCTYTSGSWTWKSCQCGCSGNSCSSCTSPPSISFSPDENTGLTFNLGI